MRLFDAHCHFDQLTLNEQKSAVVAGEIISVSTDYSSGEKNLQLAQQYSGVYPCLGLHPEYFDCYDQLDKVCAQIDRYHQQIVGVGEIGLPHFYLDQFSEKQQIKIKQDGLMIFEQLVKKASHYALMCNLHIVGNDAGQAIAILERYSIQSAVFHWFHSSEHYLQQIIDNQWFISVNPVFLFDINYAKWVAKIPLQALLLETDAPWLLNNERTNMTHLQQSLATLADLHGLAENEFAEILYKNMERLIGQLLITAR